MSFASYLFEKACFAPGSLARAAEDLKLLPVGSPAQREVAAYLNVALRYSLKTCSEIAGLEYDAAWVMHLARDGDAAWRAVQVDLENALFGPAAPDDGRPRIMGMPRAVDPDEEARKEVDVQAVGGVATMAVSSLVDLADALRKHGCFDLPDARFGSYLGTAFNGLTKVISSLIAAEWSTEWPSLLLEQGRAGLGPLESEWRKSAEFWQLGARPFVPLDEAWLSDVDPERTPEAEQAAERQRRANVTRNDRILHDLVAPERYRPARLAQLLVDKVPGHDVCADYARSPKGTLVLHGEFRSGLHPIQWAIGQHWFIEELQQVGSVEWRDVVEDNLMAQNRGLWECPYLLIGSLCPVALLSGGGNADPGYAERMLEHRLLAGKPTVVTVERYGWELLNLRSRTVELLKDATNVVLPRLSDQELEESGLPL